MALIDVDYAFKYLRGCVGKYPSTYAVGLLTAADEIAKIPTIEVPRWIPVTERLPENEKTVLVCAEIRSGSVVLSHVIVRAFHTDGKTPVCDSLYSWEYLDCEEWSEEHDDFVVTEGWWESVRYGEEFSAVHDFVTHWMPLPNAPKDGE